MISWFVFLLIGVSAFLSFYFHKLTLWAAVSGCAISAVIYWGAGANSLALLAAFFILGTFATYLKADRKAPFNKNENKSGRTAAQVVANAGIGGLFALGILMFPKHTNLFTVVIAASFASATSDTLSSELGNLYGRKFYNILTFKKDEKGLDGVVSLEGSLFGVAGAITIAFIYIIGNGWSANFYWIVLAGTLGNLSDSILGATLERRNILNNNAVNFANTAFASMVLMIIYFLSG